MDDYRVDMAFYVKADSEESARLQVEDGISAQLAADYDWIDTYAIRFVND
jgi:hypothetical protein